MPVTKKINFNSPAVWVGLIIFVGLIVYLIARLTREKGAPTPKPILQPWGLGLSAADSDKIREYTINLHNDMDGINLTGHDSALYQAYLIEPYPIFAGVYNDFNSMYIHEEEGTLKEWIDSEYFYLAANQANADSILSRFAANNLT